MDTPAFYRDSSVYAACGYIKGDAFKDAAAWVKKTFLPALGVNSGLTQDSCAHFCRVECLLPHISFA